MEIKTFLMISEIFETLLLWTALFNQMMLVIPIFHTEFDALKISFKRFGDFWWEENWHRQFFWRILKKTCEVPTKRAHYFISAS